MLFGPPPRAANIAGWALLPLRAFLGFTFCFAGLQKLANPNFFSASNPAGIQASLLAAERFSPLHPLLGHLLRFAVPIGILMALGELAVGIGTLLGLWSRLAAVGGAIIAFSLFLTVSWHASPYYTGADLIYCVSFLPLVVAGSCGVLSLDGIIAARARFEAGQGPPNVVPVPFAVIQDLCGNYEDDRCAAKGGAACDSRGCPYLQALQPTDLLHPGSVERRRVVLGGAAVAGAGAIGLFVAGAAAGLGRAVGGAGTLPSSGEASLPGAGGSAAATSSTTTPSTTASSTTTPTRSTTAPPASTTTTPGGAPTTAAPPTTTTTGPKPRGTAIGPAHDVPVGGAAGFTDPSSGDPAIVLQPTAGSFVAYDAVCPHAGCTVGYSRAAQLLVCPCHGSEFNPANGAVEVGPAPHGLRDIAIAQGSDGQLYVDG